MHPKARKILSRLRLGRMFTGVFVKANDGLMDMLRMVEPYVTYGLVNQHILLFLVFLSFAPGSYLWAAGILI